MYIFNTDFLKSNYRLWHPYMLDEIFKLLKDFSECNDPEAKEQCLQMLIFEFADARSKFMQEMQDIHLIMKCRTKGDNNSHFGGQECAKFMGAIAAACDKYIQSTAYASPIIEGSIAEVIDKIRKKARGDRSYANTFELSTKQTYLTYGTDKTLDIFRESGYTV